MSDFSTCDTILFNIFLSVLYCRGNKRPAKDLAAIQASMITEGPPDLLRRQARRALGDASDVETGSDGGDDWAFSVVKTRL